MERRKFIKNAALGSIILPDLVFGLNSCDIKKNVQTITDLHQYEPNLRDRLWMWGHGPGTTNGLYNIPTGNNIDMADAIDYMGIPNICVIRWEGKPEPPFDEYIKQFKKTKRVVWSIVDGAPQDFNQKKTWGFELTEKMPNLTGLCCDDFFGIIPNLPQLQTVEQLQALKKEVGNLKRKIDLSCVVYSTELQPERKGHLNSFDTIFFWTWHATDLVKLEENFTKYRQIVPDKPTLLGIYMWDFGNSKPVPIELMKLQLDFALKKFKEREIEGMIFHCTPLVDLGLEAVDYSRNWIAEHAAVTR